VKTDGKDKSDYQALDVYQKRHDKWPISISVEVDAKDIEPNMFLIVPPTIFGFEMREKIWGKFFSTKYFYLLKSHLE
jgi:hypothetical protein